MEAMTYSVQWFTSFKKWVEIAIARSNYWRIVVVVFQNPRIRVYDMDCVCEISCYTRIAYIVKLIGVILCHLDMLIIYRRRYILIILIIQILVICPTMYWFKCPVFCMYIIYIYIYICICIYTYNCFIYVYIYTYI